MEARLTPRYCIDAVAAMNNSLLRNNSQQLQQLPPLQPLSFVRSLPLFVATMFGVISAGIAAFLLPINQKKSVQRRALLWITCTSCIFCAVLISIAFGVTFQTYATNIQDACSSLKQQNSQYICSSYTPSAEIILLGLAIGLFVISSIYCYLIINQIQPHKSSYKTHNTTNSNFSFYASTTDNTQSIQQAEENVNEKAHSIEEDETVWNTNRHKERLSLRPPPPPSQQLNGGCRSNNTDGSRSIKRSQSNRTVTNKNYSMTASNRKADAATNVTPTTQNSSSLAHINNKKFTSSELSINSDILVPPTLPFATNSGNRSRPSSSYSGARPLSQGSDNTFGAAFNNSDAAYSPSIDDGSMTSYMDYNRNQRSDSVASQSTNTNNMIYATTNGSQSNHTLGPFTLYNNRPNSQHYPNNNSLEDQSSKRSSSINIPQSQQDTSASPSSAAGENNDLQKRINDYLQKP